MNFLRKWVAERRRPDIITDQYLEWTLVHNRFITLSLLCYVQSDDRDDYRPSIAAHGLLLLEGEYLHVHKEDFFDPETETTSACEVEEHVEARDVRVHEANDLYHIELLKPKTGVDKILDMPNWMNHSDVRFDTMKQAWFLFWSWTWKPSST